VRGEKIKYLYPLRSISSSPQRHSFHDYRGEVGWKLVACLNLAKEQSDAYRFAIEYQKNKSVRDGGALSPRTPSARRSMETDAGAREIVPPARGASSLIAAW